MRGEKPYKGRRLGEYEVSPPRARGEAKFFIYATGKSGITPACAGRRLCDMNYSGFEEDHPRVRGEKPKAQK